jgi:Ras-related protein Rap-1A
MHTGDGFLLVYSITDDQTLEELKSIREQILRVHKNKKVWVAGLTFPIRCLLLSYLKVPMVVVGNKVDLSKTQRAVSKEEGKALADEFGAAFLEITVSRTEVSSCHPVSTELQAKENFKVKDSFEALIRKITSKNPTAGRSDGSGSVYGAGKIDK